MVLWLRTTQSRLKRVLCLGAAFLLAVAVFLNGCSNSLAGPSGQTDAVEVPLLVEVQAGAFTMGDGEAQCGQDERQVTLTRSFHIGQYEVTNREYVQALQWAYDNGYVTVDSMDVRDNLDGTSERLLQLEGDYGEIQFDAESGEFFVRQSPSPYAQAAYPSGYTPADHPVKMITWYGAVRFCDWLSLWEGLPRAYQHSGDWACGNGDPYAQQGYRLPTDAEWEYAAQHDDESLYPWGDEEPDCTRANLEFAAACVGWTTPVGAYPAAPASLGLLDMAGNVYEWCNDWYLCDLGHEPALDPIGPVAGNYRVLRGGSWHVYGPSSVRCAARVGFDPNDSPSFFGFRVARSAASVPRQCWEMLGLAE